VKGAMDTLSDEGPRLDAAAMGQRPEARPGLADPVLILSPPCTFSWVVCGMLGQHPEMYGLPELHLFTAETMAGWWDRCYKESFEMDHGLVRTVAELFFGGQDEDAVSRARGWLRRRAHLTTGMLLEVLTDRLKPLVPVERSPSLVYRPETLHRALEMFPKARFLHLVSHPRRYGELVLRTLEATARGQPLPASHWLVRLASYPSPGTQDAGGHGVVDPQWGWLVLNSTVRQFLASVAEDRRRIVRGEDLFADGGEGLASVAAWLGLRTDTDAVEEMRHPERSPYARPGPSSAPFGSDLFLLKDPLVRPEWTQPRSLEGPLGWRADGGQLSPEVQQLAREFGYS
jgi:Sulfotransferase family